ncbi:MAG: AsmA family protein [Planctomycetes bacterium]|nr:AsmA family protein [Planctomycetota bacterium]MBL7106633.1 AsmA family protein [Phycisphaerae bacterium]
MKTLKKIIALIIILIAVVVVLFYLFAERALKISIEVGATKALNVGVSVDDVDLGLFAGKLSINELIINNPAGYQNKTFLKLGKADIKISTGSLLSDTVNIQSIKLDRINLTIEQKDLIKNNLSEIIKNIPSKEKPKPQQPKSGKKLHIDDLEITNVSVSVKLLPIPGKADTVTLNLPPIKMQNIGSKEDVDVGDLSKKILVAIAEKIAQVGEGKLPTQMLGDIKGQLEQLSTLPEMLLKEGSKILEKGEGLGKDVIESGKDIGEGLKKGLEGIFKEKKE